MHTERLESLETRRSIWVMASKAAIASRAGEFFGAEFSRSKWNKYLWIVSLKSVCVYIFKKVALAYELAPRMTVVWLWFRNGRVPRIVFIVFLFFDRLTCPPWTLFDSVLSVFGFESARTSVITIDIVACTVDVSDKKKAVSYAFVSSGAHNIMFIGTCYRRNDTRIYLVHRLYKCGGNCARAHTPCFSLSLFSLTLCTWWPRVIIIKIV